MIAETLDERARLVDESFGVQAFEAIRLIEARTRAASVPATPASVEPYTRLRATGVFDHAREIGDARGAAGAAGGERAA